VLLQVAFRAKAHRAGVAAKRALEVVDVDVEAQLGRLAEDLLADAAHGFALFVDLEDLLKKRYRTFRPVLWIRIRMVRNDFLVGWIRIQDGKKEPRKRKKLTNFYV
jgi:hypothetical protein